MKGQLAWDKIDKTGSAVMDLKSNELRKLLTDIVYLAKKEGRAYGPFGKVY